MRHSKYGRAERREITPRRVAAAKVAIQREIERAGLFADEFVTQRDPLARVNRNEDGVLAWTQAMRATRARMWRAARRRLRALPARERSAVYERWQLGPYPGTPEYLSELVRDVEIRRFSLVPAAAGEAT